MRVTLTRIGGGMLNSYVLETPEGVIAVDTGLPGGFDRYLKRFTKRWPLSELKFLFLTHHHGDHAGFLKALLDACDARVVLSPNALAPLRAGKNAQPPGMGYLSRPVFYLSRLTGDLAFPGVDPGSRAVCVQSEEDQVFERMGLPIQILPLPGHTADSLGLFLPETGQLVAGDAAMHWALGAARHSILIEDPKAYQASWDRMLALNLRMIYPSHGAPFPPADLVKYRHYLDGRALIPPRPSSMTKSNHS